ncbi:MAG: hypothetical protein K9J17_14120 [Flavobacteriales bacterium]|nr:hypothetical protein [Flavobacteriales bacterium]
MKLATAQQLMLENNGVRVFGSELSDKNPGITTTEVFDITDNGCTALMVNAGREQTFSFWDYDQKLNVTQQTAGNGGIGELIKPQKGENAYGFVCFGHQFYYLRGTTDYKTKENNLVLYRISKDQNVAPEAIQLSTINGEGFYDNMNYSGLTMKKSDDGTKLMIAIKLGHDRSKSGNLSYRFRIIVLSESIEKLWESDIKFSDPAGSIDVGGVGSIYGFSASTFEIGNNGNVFCWAQLDRGKDKSDSDRYKLKLYRMDAEGVYSTTVARPPSVTEVRSTMGNSRMILVAPYTAEGNAPFNLWNGQDKTGGFEYLDWDGNEGSEVARTKIPLTVEHLSKNATTKQIEDLKKDASKKPVSKSRLACTQVHLLEDGSIVITATSGISNAGIYRGMLDPNIFDIHVFRLNENKELVFSDRAPIYHLASVKGTGFESVVVGKKLFLLFNDIPLNVGRDWSAEGPEKFYGSNGQLSLIAMDTYDQSKTNERKAVWTQSEMGANFKLGATAWKPGNKVGYFYLQGAREKNRMVQFNLD